MLARDVMTADVVTVDPDARVSEIAGLLLERRISAVPVVDAERHVIGIVSEGDLMRRPELKTEKRPGSWWLSLFAAPETSAEEYAKSHGVCAGDVMTSTVVTVSEDTPLAEIANILEEKHVKRVPVTREERLVGIVSRANLLQGLATQKKDDDASFPASDQSMRDRLLDELRQLGWVRMEHINVIVKDGVVHLWGLVETSQEIKAITVAAERVAGTMAVEAHLSQLQPWVYSSE